MKFSRIREYTQKTRINKKLVCLLPLKKRDIMQKVKKCLKNNEGINTYWILLKKMINMKSVIVL